MLAKKLREILRKIQPVVGYNTKIVEKAGRKLRNLLPNTNSWKGQACRKLECRTCSQEETKIDCRKRNNIYKNLCELCNPREEKPSKKKGKELQDKHDHPSISVGERSRSITERTLEHWKDVANQDEESHKLKHWQTIPEFRFQVLKFCRSALERQVGEATRISLRGNCLNSKAGYNRSELTRLILKPEDNKLTKSKV